MKQFTPRRLPSSSDFLTGLKPSPLETSLEGVAPSPFSRTLPRAPADIPQAHLVLPASGTVLGPFPPRRAAPALPSPPSSPLALAGPEQLYSAT